MQSQSPPSRARTIASIAAAVVVAPWVFVALCWIVLAVVRGYGRPLREIPFFWGWAVLAIVVAFAAAILVAVLVMRLVRGGRPAA